MAENDEDHKDPLAGEPVEEPAVTGRPVDVPEANSTFASRKANGGAEPKAVRSAENKAVKKASSKNK